MPRRSTRHTSKPRSSSSAASEPRAITSFREAEASGETNPLGPGSDPRWRRKVARQLLGWFDRNARTLPWRGTQDPYLVWISEVMLQQTQVVTVVPYFQRFVACFPNLRVLAAASEQEVLRLWEGLGYYRRARQLHKAAQLIVAEHDGEFPQTFQEVISLPGIGRYTAGAVLSIALGQRHPILEANSQRVLCRLIAHQENPSATSSQHLLWSLAESLLPQQQAGEFNQALMELGSEVCSPRDPACHRCPLAGSCEAGKLGLQAEIPLAPPKVRYEQLREVAVVIPRARKVLLRKCQPDERWAGLWDFPRFAIQSTDQAQVKREITSQTQLMTGLVIELEQPLTSIKHGVTRYRITLDCWQAASIKGRLKRGAAELTWVPIAKLGDYPLSTTGRKISKLLEMDCKSSSSPQQ